MCFIFRLPPNSFTSLYHDNAEESLVKGSVHVEYVGLVFVGDRIHICLYIVCILRCVCVSVSVYVCVCTCEYVYACMLHVHVCVCVHISLAL